MSLLIIIIFAGVYFSIQNFRSLPLKERCDNNYISYENGNIIITHNKHCVKYLTDNSDYVIKEYNSPFLGPDEYLLKRND